MTRTQTNGWHWAWSWDPNHIYMRGWGSVIVILAIIAVLVACMVYRIYMRGGFVI